MPNLNDKDLEPVSFIKGGFTHGGQVHLEGTYAYLPKELARLTEAEQIDEMGDVYWSQGLRRGFIPASETYLAGEYQRRIQNDMEATDKARRASARIDDKPVITPSEGARVITGGPVELAGGPGGPAEQAAAHTEENVGGAHLQNPQTMQDITERLGDPLEPGSTDPTDPGGEQLSHGGENFHPLERERDAEGNAAVHEELSTATTDHSLTAEERSLKLERQAAETTQGDVKTEPFPGAYDANLEETREWLSTANDQETAQFVAWEKARQDRAPRVTILKELDAMDEEN